MILQAILFRFQRLVFKGVVLFDAFFSCMIQLGSNLMDYILKNRPNSGSHLEPEAHESLAMIFTNSKPWLGTSGLFNFSGCMTHFQGTILCPTDYPLPVRVDLSTPCSLFSDIYAFLWRTCDSKRNDVKERKKRNLMKASQESYAARIIPGSTKQS